MDKPLIIAFAGLDGSGKSTQIEEIKKRFAAQGFRIKVQRQFETEIGRMCYDIIKCRPNSYIRAIAFALDKYAYNFDAPANACYDLILCDRSHYCALAYASAQGVSEDWIRSLYQYSQDYALCLYLDISPATSLLRKEPDAKSPSITESQFIKVRENYLALVENGELQRIDAEQEFAKVTDDIETAIWEALNKCH